MFKEMFKTFVAGESEEETAENRPARIEAHMLRWNVDRDVAVTVDKYVVDAQIMIAEKMGEFIDAIPPHLLPFALHSAVGTASLSLEALSKFVGDTCLLSEMIGDVPMIANPNRPNCQCSNCVAARDIHNALRHPPKTN